jgi:predicted house-cleaning noncanonical NTP pyrophosphatase (MazG superfamily)
MKTIPQYKAVRDKIPDIIKADGQNPIFEQVSKESFLSLLVAKLNEERLEYIASGGNVDELADMLEVIYAIGMIHGYQPEELELIRKTKRETRGGFEQRIYLQAIEANGEEK